ncbi:TonB-dependent receptor [Chitinimonas sp.]|uniref:TonB-dependent receptor plug domain-containing protein n=1 Tax=Chitinimonas sp. TaxID=1934313 RepID=UPI002F9331BB
MPLKHLAFRPCRLLLLVACALQAYADDVKPAPAAPPADDKINVRGSQATDERRLSTAAKVVVTREEIVRYGDSTLADVLKRLPGVTIGGVQGRGGEIRMRGLGSGYTQILLNGEPAPPGFSLDSVSPELIERIEVMRAATAEFSTQAIAGAINIVLKKAVHTAQKELKLNLAEESDRYSPSVNGQWSDRDGNFSYSLAANLILNRADRPLTTVDRSDDGQTATQLRYTNTTRDDHYNSINLAPRLNWKFGEGETLTSQSFASVNQYKSGVFERAVTELGDQPAYPNNDTHIDVHWEMLRSNLNWVHKLANDGKLDTKFGVNFNKRRSEVVLLGYDQNMQQGLRRTVTSGALDKGYTLNGKYSSPSFEDHVLAVGWDGEYSERGEDRIQRDQNFDGRPSINIDEDYVAKVSRLALFAQDEWTINPRWSAYAGLRWEGLNTRSTGNTIPSAQNRSSVVSPLAQVLWKIPDTKNDQLRFGLTRTYKAPNTGNLIPRRYISVNNTQNSPDYQGNPDLKPELAWGLDLAYEHYLSEGGLLSASTFVRRISDVTLRDLSLVNGRWISQPLNKGNANTRGIELEAKFRLKAVMPTAPAIDLRANYTRAWSTVDKVPGPNNRLDSQTPVSANLGLDYKLDSLPLTVGGNFSFQGGGSVRLSDAQYSYNSAKRVLDGYALWKFDPKMQLRVSLSNVLHQDNLAQSRYVDTRGRLVQDTITPSSTVVRASLELKF